jgi:hypothetical protein
MNHVILTIIHCPLLRKLSPTITVLVLCTNPRVHRSSLIRENQLLSFNTGYLIVSYLSPFTYVHLVVYQLYLLPRTAGARILAN